MKEKRDDKFATPRNCYDEARGVSMFAVSREDLFAGVIGAENNRMT